MFSAAKSMAGAMCIKVMGSSQKVCCPIHPGKQAAAASSRQEASKQQALVWSSKNPTEIHGFDPQKPLKRFNKSLQIS